MSIKSDQVAMFPDTTFHYQVQLQYLVEWLLKAEILVIGLLRRGSLAQW